METDNYYDKAINHKEKSLPVYEIRDEEIDKFISQRSNILNSKLQVLFQEIMARLAIKNKNLIKVNDDLNLIKDKMQKLSPQAHYVNDSVEKEEFHKLNHTSFELEKEKREQDVSCWNDVTRVIHELLNTWEAHQQSAARARLMQSGGLDKIIASTYNSQEELHHD